MEKQLGTLEGSVDSFIYKNEDNGFAVLMLDSGGEPITVVGEIGNVEEGEELRLTGEYVNHPKFGVQFKARLCERALPKTASSIQKYLASGVIKGIGPVMAKKIVNMFGDETLKVFESEPERLTEIDGLSIKKARKFSEEFKSKFAARALMIYLAQYQISSYYGVRAYKRWGENAQEMIMNNPYVMCTFGVDLPFSKADEIASQMELPADNDNRVKAGILSVLAENMNVGHTCLPVQKLEVVAIEFLGVTKECFRKALTELLDDEYIYEYKVADKPYVMLKDLFAAENYISRRLSIMRSYTYDSKIDYSEVINLAEEQNNIKYADIQRKAINTALSCGFLVLTGGPGTGKTTTLNAIISLFEQQGQNVMLCAPTGRAAKRISELTGYEAKTIHRMLEVSFSEGDMLKFVHNENNPLECDVMIIDEMSMVDTLLFEALLRALSLNCKLIMVGDSDQLPSVGAGNVLKDIIDSGIAPTVELKEIFRQSQASKIVTNAHKIVSGEHIELDNNSDDFFFFQRLEYEELQSLVVSLCKDRLPEAYAISPTEDIQVLSPSRKGPSGTVELNRILQQSLNPPHKDKPEIKTFLYTFRAGDKVMQTRNNYDITWTKTVDEKTENGSGIFNGDIGKIIKVNRVLGIIDIEFDGRLCKYNLAMLEHLELAYAVTVHKSQGSEFDYVILTAFSGYDKLYYRNLLYTAVTRAKKMLIIVGSKKRVEFMIDNNKRTLRYTCLKKMLDEEQNTDEQSM